MKSEIKIIISSVLHSILYSFLLAALFAIYITLIPDIKSIHNIMNGFMVIFFISMVIFMFFPPIYCGFRVGWKLKHHGFLLGLISTSILVLIDNLLVSHQHTYNIYVIIQFSLIGILTGGIAGYVGERMAKKKLSAHTENS